MPSVELGFRALVHKPPPPPSWAALAVIPYPKQVGQSSVTGGTPPSSTVACDQEPLAWIYLALIRHYSS